MQAPQAWSRRFAQTIKEFPRYKKALDKLEKAGFGYHDHLLTFLYRYTSSQNYMSEMQRSGQKLERRVSRCISEINSTWLAMKEEFATIRAAPPHRRRLDHGQTMLLLRRTGYCLRRVRRYYAALGSRRVAETDESLLVLLSVVIKMSTGKAHYSEIAKLIEASYKAHGHTEQIAAKTVQQKVVRYRKKFPRSFLFEEEEEAIDTLDAWYTFGPKVSLPRLRERKRPVER